MSLIARRHDWRRPNSYASGRLVRVFRLLRTPDRVLGLPGAVSLDRLTLPTGILLAASIIAVMTKPYFGEVSSALIFVLGITLVGAFSGLTMALISAVLASAIFNFVVAEPVLTFRLSTGTDLAPPLIFTLCALVSGLLAGRLKDKARQVQESNLRLESLLETSRTLQTAMSEAEVQQALRMAIPSRLGVELALYRFENDAPRRIGSGCDRLEWDMVAREAMEEEAEFVHKGNLKAYRLQGSKGCVGALVCDHSEQPGLDRSFMPALAGMMGLALERAQLAAMIAETRASARTEELKTALLSSVSHDLRTPITAISASASSLIDYGAKFDRATSTQLLQGIVDECGRLNRFTANLLEMTRLQAGQGGLTASVLPVADLVRNVVSRMKSRAGAREIRLNQPEDDILVEADVSLFELVLVNILQNAISYSDEGTVIVVQCESDARFCIVTVTDQGCGIPAADQAKVFDRFFRVKRSEPSPLGSGLGLAIAKGFVEAYDGTVEITSPVMGGKGTTVTVRLPLAVVELLQ